MGNFCDITFKRNKDSIEVTNKNGYPSKLYPKIVEKVKPQSNVVYQNGKSFFDTLIEQGKLMNNNPDELSLGLYSLAYNSNKTEGYWESRIDELLPKGENQVNYQMKSVDILGSAKGEQVFEKGKKAGWSLDKILTELQIPKEQKQLILDLNKTNREDIIVDLMSKYGFGVEINVAKDVIISPEDIDPTDNLTYGQSRNSHYYGNLTVSGGTNYTENEISTPLITPSIKGHAQFASNQGIGWFRSDDKVKEGTFKKETKLKDLDINDVPNEFMLGTQKFIKRNNEWYMSNNVDGELIKMRSVGLGEPEVLIAYQSLLDNNIHINNNYTGNNYSINSKTFGTLTKTRRILEVQSDLFQKGRNESILTLYGINNSPDTNENEDGTWTVRNNGENIKYKNKKEADYAFNILNKKILSASDNQFFQLLNKDNNWVKFFVQSIIQDSAKKGYEKVLFPSGNTASKVEGHTTLEEFKKQKEDRIKELESIILNKSELLTEFEKNDDVYLNYHGFQSEYNFVRIRQNFWNKKYNINDKRTLSGDNYDGYVIQEYTNGKPHKITEITKEKALDLIEDQLTIKLECAPGKHDMTKHNYVFEHDDGRYYKFGVDISYNEGIQIYGDTVKAIEVIPVQVTKTEWRIKQ